jgi:hypothetical protein
MILRRIEEGAAKWALRDLRREEETSICNRKRRVRILFSQSRSSSKCQATHPTQISTASIQTTQKMAIYP